MTDEKLMCPQVSTLCSRFLADLDTAISLKVSTLIRFGEWDQIAACRVDPKHYLDTISGAEKFRRDYQAVELLRKYPGLPTTIDTAQVAEDGFWAAEAQCKRTNDRLLRFLTLSDKDGDLPPLFEWDGDRRIAGFIRRVQKRIKTVLGALPSKIHGRFGPGATFESKGHPRSSCFTLADKMSIKLTSTSRATALVHHYVYPTAWGRAKLLEDPYCSSVALVRGNRFTTVPKDATKDRGIAIEPGCNVFLQLGIGQVIRERLLWWAGIDLKHGQAHHHRLAREGSILGNWCTIDLSSASDTVALRLVQLLLPADWFELLCDLRSPRTQIQGEIPCVNKRGEARVKVVKRWILLEKFSSMGNGFTFELESLIFWALSAEAGQLARNQISVYGDDIIVPTAAAENVLAVLKYFGFTPNPRKTFVDGPFRESCGGDFFCGVDVTPYRITNEISTPSDWIGCANGLWRMSRLGNTRRDPIRRARNFALAQLPSDIRQCRGPVALGDLVIHDHPAVFKPEVRSSISWFRVWRPVPIRTPINRWSTELAMAAALYGAASSGLARPDYLGYLTHRNGVSGFRFGRVAYS